MNSSAVKQQMMNELENIEYLKWETKKTDPFRSIQTHTSSYKHKKWEHFWEHETDSEHE